MQYKTIIKYVIIEYGGEVVHPKIHAVPGLGSMRLWSKYFNSKVDKNYYIYCTQVLSYT